MSQTTQTLSSSIPADLGAQRRSGVNAKFVVGGLLLLAFVGFLGFNMLQATTSTGAYYMTVAELTEDKYSLVGQRIRVNGIVADGSEDWNAQEITLKFMIDDENGANVESLPIVFYGPRPDNFQRASSAIAEGTLLTNGTFKADTLLLKCPSRYEESPEEIFVESTEG